jgi:hydrogenase maturation protease
VNRAVSQKILVLGLGNPLSGDDSFGVRTLEALQQILQPLPQNIILIEAGTDLLNYVEDLASYDRVVLIDAVLDPEGKAGKPGSILVLEENEFSSWPETSPGVHQITPLLALKLFRTLHPEAKTTIVLIALLIDQLTQNPNYVTDPLIAQAAISVKQLL